MNATIKIAVIALAILFCFHLTIGCASTPTQPLPPDEPTPTSTQRQDVRADIEAKLKALAGEKMTLSYPIGPTLNQKWKLKEVQVDAAPILESLFAQPVYGSGYEPPGGIFITLYFDANRLYEHDFYNRISLTADNGVLIGLNTQLSSTRRYYSSYSKELYDSVFKLTNVQAYHVESLANVNSITFMRKLKNKKLKSFAVDDEQTIKKITGLLSVSELCDYKYDEAFENIDVEMVLHTNDGDILCHFESVPEYPDEAILQVNRFYCYRSKELLDYLRSLVK